MKSVSQRGIYLPMFTAALFTMAKIQKQAKCPSTDEWIKDVEGWGCVYMCIMCVCVCVCVCVYIYIYYSTIRKKNEAIWNNMGGP